MKLTICLLVLTLSTQLAAQVDEPFHFERAPRHYELAPGKTSGIDAGDAGAFIDFDSDGDLDVVSLIGGRIEYGRNDGGSLSQAGVTSLSPHQLIGVDLDTADFSGDGIPDLVVLGQRQLFPYPAAYLVLLGDGAGGFSAQAPVDMALPWDSVALEFAVEDVDLDGSPDLGVWDLIGGVGMLWIQRGDGTSQLVTLSDRVVSAAFGDVDGSGLPDLVALVRDSNQVGSIEVRPNGGGGSFQLATGNFGSLNTPYGLALADFDQDGDLDALTTETEPATFLPNFTDLMLFPGDGGGGLGAPLRSPLYDTWWPAADFFVGHLDQDAHLDVAASFVQYNIGQLGLVSTLRGDGQGGFQELGTVALAANEITYGDFSGKGTPELVTANGDVVPADPAGVVGSYELASVPWTPGSIAAPLTVFDFDLDGIDDCAFFDGLGYVIYVYLGDGEGGFTALSFPVNNLIHNGGRLQHGDVDGDGWIDLVVPRISELITYRNLSGVALAPPVVTPISGCTNVNFGRAWGDVNGDGRVDYVRNGIYLTDAILALGQADGSFSFDCVVLPEPAASHIELADVNGDGFDDLVYASFLDFGLTIVTGSSSGFGPSLDQQFTPLLLSGMSAPVDLDSDGDLDLLAETQNAGQLATLANDGAGVFTLAGLFDGPSLLIRDLEALDMNADGQLDLFVHHSFQGVQGVSIFEGTGSGYQSNHLRWDLGTHGAPLQLRIGDLDGDLLPDVAVGGAFGDVELVHPAVYFNRSLLRGEGLAEAGEVYELRLDSPAAAHDAYFLLVSALGTWPGVPLGTATLPLNYDPVLSPLGLGGAGGVFVQFAGILDGEGKAGAQISLPASFSTANDLPVDLAYVTLELQSPFAVRTSNSLGTVVR